MYFLFLISHVGPPACCCGQCHQIVLIKPNCRRGWSLTPHYVAPAGITCYTQRFLFPHRSGQRYVLIKWETEKKEKTEEKKKNVGRLNEVGSTSHVSHLTMFCMSLTKILQNHQCQKMDPLCLDFIIIEVLYHKEYRR